VLLAALALSAAGCGTGATVTVTSVTTVTRTEGSAPLAASRSAPARDITRAVPPRPSGAASAIHAAGARSLFRAANLAPVIQSLTARFGGDASVVQAALYPGELDLVIAKGNDARTVRTGASGRIRTGRTTGFDGSRQAASIYQLDAGRPEELARRIAAHGGVPVSDLDRFVLTTKVDGDLAGWVIHPRHGRVVFRSLLVGGRIERVSPGGGRRAI
jgi:hypothetical protein